ncbi:hypothetical protein, partial [Sphingomonas sp. PAMC 26617]|uniref:hypothetical protein n=1 Tax=Sphingomonas sp. PAMC 26617 TaxID=1112216 RepID=UPI0002885F0A
MKIRCKSAETERARPRLLAEPLADEHVQKALARLVMLDLPCDRPNHCGLVPVADRFERLQNSATVKLSDTRDPLLKRKARPTDLDLLKAGQLDWRISLAGYYQARVQSRC